MRASSASPARSRTVGACALLALLTFLSACHSLSFHPAPVVPTKHRLPWSAHIRLLEVAAYPVEPGSTMTTNPHLQNFVGHTGSIPSLPQKEWESAILDYVTARGTFPRVTSDGPADLAITLRTFIYIDPGASIDYNHIYMARTEAVVSDPKTGRPLTRYSGLGRAIGPIVRRSKDDDEPAISKAVQASLNDLFDKLENDSRLALL